MEDKTNQINSIFVWRGHIRCLWSNFRDKRTTKEFESINFKVFEKIYKQENYEKMCPFCSSAYIRKLIIESIPSERKMNVTCPVCGFWWDEHEGISYDELSFSTICSFDINSNELALHELGSHLNRKNEDLYTLSSRRFEEVVADIFKVNGYFVKLTKQSRDGGFDLIVLENSNNIMFIVECKRYNKTKKVTIGAVRQLLGVQLANGYNNATLVTTSYFTGPAILLAKHINDNVNYFQLNLFDVEDICRALNVYNTKLPPTSLNTYLKAIVS